MLDISHFMDIRANVFVFYRSFNRQSLPGHQK